LRLGYRKKTPYLYEAGKKLKREQGSHQETVGDLDGIKEFITDEHVAAEQRFPPGRHYGRLHHSVPQRATTGSITWTTML
jgi:hypothetical protein